MKKTNKNTFELSSFNWDLYKEDKPLNFEEDDDFDIKISLKVSKDIYKNWLELKERMKMLNGYDNESKVFEFAIIEALNIPYESLD